MTVKRKHVLFLSLILMLAGCGNQEHSHAKPASGSENSLDPISVKMNVDPLHPKVNQPFYIQAKVTQNKSVVTDADDVQFEIWKDGDRKHKKIKASNGSEGIYQIKITYSKPGKYHVISHVSARDMHTMPQKQFTIQ
jgi:hypothetical protein